jgi:hypothetical protein
MAVDFAGADDSSLPNNTNSNCHSEPHATNGNGYSALHPTNWVPIKEEPLYEKRRIRVATIGAGFSGLMVAHKVPSHPFQHQTLLKQLD